MYCQNNKTLIYNLSGLLGIFCTLIIQYLSRTYIHFVYLNYLVVSFFSVYPFKPDNYKLLLFYFGQKHNFICWIYFIKNIDFEKKPTKISKTQFCCNLSSLIIKNDIKWWCCHSNRKHIKIWIFKNHVLEFLVVMQ